MWYIKELKHKCLFCIGELSGSFIFFFSQATLLSKLYCIVQKWSQAPSIFFLAPLGLFLTISTLCAL